MATAKKAAEKAKTTTKEDDAEARRIAKAQEAASDDADTGESWDDELDEDAEGSAEIGRAPVDEGDGENDGWDEDEPGEEVEVENPADTETDVENPVPVSGLAAMVEMKGDNATGLDIQQAKERVRQNAIDKAKAKITDDEAGRLEVAANLSAKAKEGEAAKREVEARIKGPANMGAPGVARETSEEARENMAKSKAFGLLTEASNAKDDRDGWRNSVELGIPVATLKKMVAQKPDLIETGNAPGGTFSPDTGILFRRVRPRRDARGS